MCVVAMLDRDFVVSRDRERKLQSDLEAVTTRLLQQEQLNMELRMKQDQLISRLQQQQVSPASLSVDNIYTTAPVLKSFTDRMESQQTEQD